MNWSYVYLNDLASQFLSLLGILIQFLHTREHSGTSHPKTLHQ